MKKFLLDFKEIDYGDFPIVGAKAYHLAKLLKKNFPVPQGFVVTTNSFQMFLKTNFLDFMHRSLTKDLSLKDSLFITSSIRNKIIKGDIHQRLSKNINKEMGKFVFDSFSVRSSTTVEDSDNISFAGQFESYLNVGRKDILRKIILCWVSLFSDRVLIYSRKKNLFLNQAQMAVMIHQMINPDLAGNIFTVDVINKNKHFILIEAVKGGGHKVTDGTGFPEKILVNRDNFSFENKPKDIDRGLIRELAQLAFKIEKFFQYPQDIEWAITKGKIYILQSRPITTII